MCSSVFCFLLLLLFLRFLRPRPKPKTYPVMKRMLVIFVLHGTVILRCWASLPCFFVCFVFHHHCLSSHRSELSGVGCLLTAAGVLWLFSTWLLTICSSTMLDIPLRPVLRHLPKYFKWYDSSHLDCILCQQEPCTCSTTDRRTAANCRVLVEPCGPGSHGEQLCVQRGQRCGGGSSPSQAAEASGQFNRWTPRGQEQPAQGPCPTPQTRTGATWAEAEETKRWRSGAGYAGCYQNSRWQVSGLLR